MILNTINYTKVFYWLTVADNAKVMFKTFIIIYNNRGNFYLSMDVYR